MHSVIVLLVLAMAGLTLMLMSRKGGTWEAAGAVLTIAPLMALVLLGVFYPA